jgi:thiol-disulfide isomerase/thioredoxin
MKKPAKPSHRGPGGTKHSLRNPQYSSYHSAFRSPHSALHIPLSALLLAFNIVFGCAPSTQRPTTAKTPSINLVRADGAALSDLVASKKGQIVLVDYWATWCPTCVENFPHTVELSRKYADKGLAAIAVSFDLFDDEPKVREFLAKQGANFDNLISSHNNVGQQMGADFDLGGPLPEYRLYDREGKLVKKWESGVDQAELDAKIQELMAAK